MNENSLILKIDAAARRGRSPRFRKLLGIGDDAALWRPKPGTETILTCDWFLEGTHFLRDKHPADSVGWKCLSRATSDVAAMGGIPICCLLSLAVPAALSGRWLDGFLAGLRRASRTFACPLVGGDTTRRGQVLINVTVVGQVPRATAVLRSTARPGDLLFVTGRLGEAELGLRLLRQSRQRIDPRDPLLRKHLYPQPRIALGRWLAERHLASAMMDLSDGLSTDLPRLCAASRAGARLETQHLPKPRLPRRFASRFGDLEELALHGGDDYELLFTVPRRKSHLIPAVFGGVPITAIGEITKKRGVVLVDGGHVSALPEKGWDPFRRPASGLRNR